MFPPRLELEYCRVERGYDSVIAAMISNTLIGIVQLANLDL